MRFILIDSKRCLTLNLAQKLSDVNMPFSEIEDLAKQSMKLPDYQNNPKIATLDDMLDLVTASY